MIIPAESPSYIRKSCFHVLLLLYLFIDAVLRQSHSKSQTLWTADLCE